MVGFELTEDGPTHLVVGGAGNREGHAGERGQRTRGAIPRGRNPAVRDVKIRSAEPLSSYMGLCRCFSDLGGALPPPPKNAQLNSFESRVPLESSFVFCVLIQLCATDAVDQAYFY